MPFQSEKQRRYLWANEPEIARDWTDTYGSGIAKALGGRIPFQQGKDVWNIKYGTDQTLREHGDQGWVGGPLKEYNPALDLNKPYRLAMNEYLKRNQPISYSEAETIPNENYFGLDISRNYIPTEELPLQVGPYTGERYSIGDMKNIGLNQGETSDARYMNDIDSGIAGLSTDVFTPRAYEAFNKDPNWWQEETGADVIKNPNFPLRKENLQELYETGKEKMGNIWEGGVDKAKWLKDAAMAGIGKTINFPIGILSALAGPPDTPYQKFMKEMFKGQVDPTNPNKDPWGKNIRSYTNTYDVTDQWDKFAGSVLGQKYGLEALSDPNLTEEEREALLEKMHRGGKGLKGYQLDRARRLSKLNLKALGWKKQRDDAIKQKEIDRERRREEARKKAADAAAAAQVRKNIQTYQITGRGGQGGDRPDTGMNRPGGGRGQSPTGGNVQGTPFNTGGLAALWPR